MSEMKRLSNFSIVVLTVFTAAFAFGQAAPAPKSAPAPSTTAKSAPKTTALSSPVDINSASMSELKSVPGIGDAYANKIMAGRPYKTKAQLKSRNILSDAVYEKVKGNLVAKQK